jgi:hypothetical protein
MKLEIFKICSQNIKFYENPSSGSRVVPRGQRDRHDVDNSSFSIILRTRRQNDEKSIKNRSSVLVNNQLDAQFFFSYILTFICLSRTYFSMTLGSRSSLLASHTVP